METGPASGAVTIEPDGAFTYSPVADFNGVDSFTYTVIDGNGGSATGTVSLTVNAVNDAPNATTDAAQVAAGGVVIIDVLANDSDVENDPLEIVSVSDATAGTVSHDGAVLTYHADPAATGGLEYVTYQVSDRNGGFATATVAIAITAVPLETTVGSEAADTLVLDDADDLIIGGLGADVIDAGGGDDRIIWTIGDGDYVIDGGTGFDEVSLALNENNASDVDVSADANGNVVIVAGGEVLTLDGVEELSIAGAEGGSTIILGDLSATDIADSTVIFKGAANGADSPDLWDGSATNKRNKAFGFDGDDTLIGGSRADTLKGGNGNDTLIGNGAADKLIGGNGKDILNGGAGADEMIGGHGDDIYIVDQAGDVVIELADEGADRIEATLSIDLEDYANVENLVLQGADDLTGSGTAGDNNLIGNAGANTLEGGAGDDVLFGVGGDDVLDGGAGADDMRGHGGDDVYKVDNVGDTVTELENQGRDRIDASITFALATTANVEDLTLTGTAAIDGIGDDAANRIVGNSAANTLLGLGGDDNLSGGDGADSLSGGLGADKMAGGAGDDRYIVDDIGDTVTEQADEGVDIIRASVDFALTAAANVENLTLIGTANLNGTGNDAANLLIGNSGSNNLSGGAGADILAGGGGGDDLNGDVGNDILEGGEGDDRLTGGLGVDRLTGGLGNDVYVVDQADSVIEATGESEGVDRLEAGFSVNLAVVSDGLEDLTLQGTANLSGIGTKFANTLQGNAGANALQGLAGDDTLIGLAGDDLLLGNEGADTMSGGLGDDSYAVDSVSDQVIELADEGDDTVNALISFDLRDISHVENLTLGGTLELSGTGDGERNTIVGNNAANILSGLGRADRLIGNGGDDELIGGSGDDTLDGGSGVDRLRGGVGDDVYLAVSDIDIVLEDADAGRDRIETLALSFSLASHVNIEDLTLTDRAMITAGSRKGTGNASDNVIVGQTADNEFLGLEGDDTLEGGGDDTYVFDDSGDVIVEAAGEGVDTIRSVFSINLGNQANVENVRL